MDEFRSKVIEKVNKQHGGDMVGLIWNGKSQYAKLACVYKDCPFNHWFTCESQGLPAKQIRYGRSINQNHSVKAHKGEKRSQKQFL